MEYSLTASYYSPGSIISRSNKSPGEILSVKLVSIYNLFIFIFSSFGCVPVGAQRPRDQRLPAPISAPDPSYQGVIRALGRYCPSNLLSQSELSVPETNDFLSSRYNSLQFPKSPETRLFSRAPKKHMEFQR